MHRHNNPGHFFLAFSFFNLGANHTLIGEKNLLPIKTILIRKRTFGYNKYKQMFGGK